MAELTELFPIGKLFEALHPLCEHTITVPDLPAFIVFCIMVVFFFHLCYNIFRGLFFWCIRNEIVQEDLEPGIHPAYPSTSRPLALRYLMENSLHAWRIVGGLEREFEVKRGQRLRGSKKLPPLVSYGSHEEVGRSSDDCAICLEDFRVGEFCQVFPECRHIFHSNCLDFWLQLNLTCPLCRSSIEE
ncbi:hypothetical protein L6164_022581 [Bauhinia variegata]|uniref:Uncharacterized protein n=1 Tax=Bauhinia variegata TaxID=167791 RepID=A0ACB9MFJ9_BAUVA|nr:hypothetical protein L6164_022581 [Bauhinia variegata]